MSDYEKCISMLDIVPEHKLQYVIAFLQGLTADEHADDAFCEDLYADYLASPDNDAFIPLEDLKKEMGL